MDSDLLFFVGLAFIFNHELDAIRQHEWRFFFEWMSLGEKTAYRLFTAAHLPLFAVIMWYARDSRFQTGMDVFLIIHLILHWTARNDPRIEFDNWFSWLWIGGGAVVGALHLIALLA